MLRNKAIHGGVIFNHGVTTNHCFSPNQAMLADLRMVANGGAAFDMRSLANGHADPNGVWAVKAFLEWAAIDPHACPEYRRPPQGKPGPEGHEQIQAGAQDSFHGVMVRKPSLSSASE